MFSAISSVLAYSGSSNIDTTIVQCALVVIIFSAVLCMDFLYKLLLGFIPRRDK